MKMQEVIDICKEKEVPYQVLGIDDCVRLYIYKKKAYENNDSFIPYLRLSFDEAEIYARYCGICDYISDEGIINIINYFSE